MFKGIITPIITPFNRDDAQTINYQATEKLIDHLIENKVDGLFLLGTNGEFHVLEYQEKVDFIEFVVKYVNSRVPVFVGCGTCGLNETIKLVKKTEELGADAISLLPPYFIKPSEKELLVYFKKVAAATKLPILLYNIPKNVGYNIDYGLFDKALDVENIIGLKDSSGDEERLLKYINLAKAKNKDVFVGSDSKISFGYQHGAKGAVAGTSNLITKHIVDLFKALEKSDQKAAKLQQDIDVLRACLKYNTVPSVLKRSVELAKICEAGPARLPVEDIEKLYDEDLKKMLDFYGLIK